MRARSLPILISCTLAVVAVLLWLRPPPAPPAPPPPVPRTPPPSGLASVPDWLEINKYQSTISRSAFLRLMDGVFTVSPAWRDFFTVEDDSVTITTNPGESFRLHFAPEGLETPPPRFWRSPEQLGPAPADKPLTGLQIAIDPGHIGGSWGKMEERWFQIAGATQVQEGDMTLAVAQLLKPKLEALGATVTLVRDKTEPVTDIRPENLREEAQHNTGEGTLSQRAQRLFYRTAEIRARARLVNEDIKPDIVLCLHFNADAWGDPNAPTLVPADHFHMILNGAYTDEEVSHPDERHDMLLKLLQGTHDEEAALATSAAAAFVERTAMPPYLYLPGSGRARNINDNPYLWARNLLANRVYRCPVAYYEPYVMNSTEDHARIQAGDYEGLREVAGKQHPSIFREYADCVALGLERYYRGHRPPQR